MCSPIPSVWEVRNTRESSGLRDSRMHVQSTSESRLISTMGRRSCEMFGPEFGKSNHLLHILQKVQNTLRKYKIREKFHFRDDNKAAHFRRGSSFYSQKKKKRNKALRLELLACSDFFTGTFFWSLFFVVGSISECLLTH